MQDAIWAGFGNAIYGGFYGCTIGTFTVPILGTATGCVGGAVFGFANGFFTATLAGAGQQILFRCLLKDWMVFDPETGEYVDTVQRTKDIIAALERFKREQQWKNIRKIAFLSLP